MGMTDQPDELRAARAANAAAAAGAGRLRRGSKTLNA